MERAHLLGRLRDPEKPFDLAVIGGGATGVGVAIDAAARGYRVALLEQSDFGKGTSSRSTKLVHGGVRYLQQGDLPLVMEALRERGILRRNAPHLVHDLPFVVPNYQWWEAPFYGIGMRVYDALAGRYGFGHSRNLSREETLERIPTIETKGLKGGVIYHDGQFDDARLLIHMVRTALEQGAVVLNHAAVVGLLRGDGADLPAGIPAGRGRSGGSGGAPDPVDAPVTGVLVEDRETGERFPVRARIVINATGAFVDAVSRMERPDAPLRVRASQGIHLVLDREFLPGDSAIMVPHTEDGRVLFAIPWLGKVLVGTTDTPIPEVSLEPRPLDAEIDFLLRHAARYLTRDPSRQDIRSVFAGIRPLVAPEPPREGARGDRATASISREHSVEVSPGGMITVLGGKWTTYRKMAQDVVDTAIPLAGLEPRRSPTRRLRIHGWHPRPERFGERAHYGSDAPELEALLLSEPKYARLLHPRLPYRLGEVVWAARHEFARTVEDVLARRTRALLLDARAAIEAAPEVARLLARELDREEGWAAAEVARFSELALGYLPD